jgi:hypothetical protein
MKKLLFVISMLFSVAAFPATPAANTAAEDAAAHKALMCYSRQHIILFMANRRDLGASLVDYRKAYPVEPKWTEQMKNEVHAIEEYVWTHPTSDIVTYAQQYYDRCLNDPSVN